MVTLSFLLIANVFFLLLIVRHALTTYANLISCDVTLSILRVNILPVCSSLIAILRLAFLYMVFEMCFNIFFRHLSIPEPILWCMTDLASIYTYHVS